MSRIWRDKRKPNFDFHVYSGNRQANVNDNIISKQFKQLLVAANQQHIPETEATNVTISLTKKWNSVKHPGVSPQHTLLILPPKKLKMSTQIKIAINVKQIAW